MRANRMILAISGVAILIVTVCVVMLYVGRDPIAPDSNSPAYDE